MHRRRWCWPWFARPPTAWLPAFWPSTFGSASSSLRACSASCSRKLKRAYPMSLTAEQELQQRLLGVTAILGLVPDPLARAVQDVWGDLLAWVGREAVQRDRAGCGLVQQGIVEAIRSERLAAVGRRLRIVVHAHPDV